MAKAKNPRNSIKSETPQVVSRTDIRAMQAAEPQQIRALSAETEARVRMRAYELFEQRGRLHGKAMEDWLRAEREIIRDTGKLRTA